MMGLYFLLVSLVSAWIALYFCLQSNRHKEKWFFFFVTITTLSVVISFGLYLQAFVQNQFQVVNVFNHSNIAMSLTQLVACSWSGQSGSLFLWLLFTQITLLIALKDKLLKKEISFFILLLHSLILVLLLQSQPFQTHSMQVVDGIGMNPVLSHPLMVTHPPFAFLSYAFLGLYFSVGMGALLKKQEFHWIHRYNYALYVAFLGLTVTMVLGSLWAYEITGWGGYWSFDPVESGSLSLWFFVLMLLHLYPFFQKSGKGRIWFYQVPIFLVFSMFYVSFLIRSGLLASFTAHTYAQGSLVVVLYGIVGILLIIPGLFLWKTYPKLSLPEKPKMLLKTYPVKHFIIMFMGFLAFLLFLQVTMPVFAKQTELASVLTKVFIGFFLFVLTLCLYQVFRKESCAGVFLRANAFSLTGVIFVLWHYPQLQDVSYGILCLYVVYIGFLWSFYWVLRTLRNISFRSVGLLFVHCAVGLLLVGVSINSPLLSAQTVFLTPGQTHQVGAYFFSQKKEHSTTSMYLGQKKTSLIACTTPTNRKRTLYPSLWHYSRNFQNYTLPVPAMLFHWKEDVQMIPFAESGTLLHTNQSVQRDGYEYKLLRLETNELENGFVLEKASLQISKNNHGGEIEQFSLQRVVHPSGKQLTTSSVYTEILQDNIHWVDTVEKDSIVVVTDKDRIQNKYEIRLKPGMFWVRNSYWLMIIGGVFLLISLLEMYLKKRKKLVQ
jgi:cytochrome c biogenesis factor